MILFNSTRNSETKLEITEAITTGLSPDGGLFIPLHFPQYDLKALAAHTNYADFAYRILQPFFAGTSLESALESMCQQAFNFAIPCQEITPGLSVLELFHGPTLSFKDVGARFIGQCLNELGRQRTILVATSGDTGSAVAASCHGLANIKAVILFPQGKISQRQQHQITCWGDNVEALAVNGRFDDCQQLVKNAFSEPRWQQDSLTTANSINIARLLPQMVYYAYASIHYANAHNFIVPSGNLGNVTACYWAKQCGFAIDNIIIATNANRVISDYLKSGKFKARDSIATLANAMDVGNPSNLERLNYLFNDFATLRQNLNAQSISDTEIEQAIIECFSHYQYLLCPHTATAFHRWKNIKDNNSWVIVATAHPAKFETVIEPLIKQTIEIPEQLTQLLQAPSHYQTIEASADDLYAYTHN